MQIHHFATLARYNGWANRRLYETCDGLAEAEYLRDRAAAFGSLHGILNHLLVVDRLWIARIEGRTQPQLRLDQILYADRIGLKIARIAEDEWLERLVLGLSDRALGEPIDYTSLEGERRTASTALVLMHLFNHQTHHRGQAHALLRQSGARPPPLDLIDFLRETGRLSVR
jgi:uncharacterized damage-inducible protein DinB